MTDKNTSEGLWIYIQVYVGWRSFNLTCLFTALSIQSVFTSVLYICHQHEEQYEHPKEPQSQQEARKRKKITH